MVSDDERGCCLLLIELVAGRAEAACVLRFLLEPRVVGNGSSSESSIMVQNWKRPIYLKYITGLGS